jgi:hypothetical protein
VSDHDVRHGSAAAQSGTEHAQPHLPPNSIVPAALALSLAVLFVGLLHEVRDTVGPAMWLVGLIGLVGSIAAWVITARRDYLELPEEGDH